MSDIEVLTTEDVDPGIVLTDGFLYSLVKTTKIHESAIFNNTGHPITVSDSYGVVSSYYSTVIPDETLAKLKLSVNFNGVIVVERRMVRPTDIGPTIDFYNKNRTLIKYNERAIEVHRKLLNISHHSKLNEFYVIYSIDKDMLSLKKSLFIRGLDIVVSIPGKEKISPLAIDNHANDILEDAQHKSTISFTYYSYSNQPLYTNILGKTIMIEPSKPIVDNELGLFLSSTTNGMLEKELIPESEYTKRNVYLDYREAKHNASLENVVSKKKVELELQKVEENIISNVSNLAIEKMKLNYDLNNKLINALLDREKASKMLESKSCKGGNNNGLIDNVKKIVEIMISIKKVF